MATIRQMNIDYVSADELTAIVRPREAVAAIRDALTAGLDPGADPPRSVVALPGESGQLLTMPSASLHGVGVKVISAVPGNADRGRPRIQGVYLVFRPPTFELVAAIDGAALTTVRTPAVSVAAVLPLLTRSDRRMRVVVFGAGPQGIGHVKTLRDVGVDLAEVTYVVRNPARVDASLVEGANVVAAQASASLIRHADIIVCATSSAVPVFDSRALKSTAVVLAVGSHEPGSREVDAALVSRSQVVVEDVATALRECGDVVLAVAEGALSKSSLLPMSEVVRGEVVLDDSRPVLFKGSGMSWQDVVVAEAAMRKHRGSTR